MSCSITFLVKYYLDNGPLCHDAQRRVHWAIWVFLHTNDLKIKSTFQFRVCYMGFGKTQPRRTNEPLIFWRFSSKSRSYKCGFGEHPLPLLGCQKKIANEVLRMMEKLLHTSSFSSFKSHVIKIKIILLCRRYFIRCQKQSQTKNHALKKSSQESIL